MEGYPALLARRILGKKPNYKSDTRQKQTQTQQDRRKQFMNTLLSTDALAPYQLTLQLDDSVCSDSFSGDPSGDKIDALLCAIQAAWAYQQTSPAFGIPSHCDALEGWIIDPEMLSLPDTAT
jgi:hypothetical protein